VNKDGMRIALAQINTTVGDIAGNERRIIAAYERAAASGADLVVTPELALAGYPPRDLLLRRSFVDANAAALERLTAVATGPGLLVGFVGRNERQPGREVTNAAALLADGKIQAVRTKTLLPTYDVFDEDRYFEPATDNAPASFRGRKLGITICEDVWNDADFWSARRYRPDPPAALADSGAEVIVNLSASPWHLGKERVRRSMLQQLAVKLGKPVLYANLVGGNDELVFDGTSLAYHPTGRLVGEGISFAEDLVLVDLGAPAMGAGTAPDEEQLYKALVLGTRDYLQKCGFKSAVLGLSGGIDSAVVACIAAAALGPNNVHGVSLPSRYSSEGSLSDARSLAEALGCRYDVIPIEGSFQAAVKGLAPVFAGRAEDTTEENIQARLRGVLLMAISNKFGSILLTTGNKSEVAVGYCTLYGDMCGGLAVINDVPKTMVYRLARWINEDALKRTGRALIPEASITKPPSAELRPNQIDQDSLPPYDTLDAILEGYVVEGKSPAELMAAGHDPAAVRRVVRLIDLSEYKRRQSAPGLRVTTKAFGVGRRMPVAQAWREA
jgi:NAD+ synthase (glutamine-hydrolysing)